MKIEQGHEGREQSYQNIKVVSEVNSSKEPE